MGSRSVLLALILALALPLAWRAAAAHAWAVGPSLRPVVPCAPIELRGVGVGCVVGVPIGLRAGDVVAASGRRVGRMAPARLEAWEAPVDVNRASLDELASLPGIGPALAARIAGARPFSTVEEVVRVRGIGPKTLARITGRLVVLPSTGSTR